MSIRLRLAVWFAVASAVVFTLGSWLFAVTLSASLLGSVDAQLTTQLDRAARYVPAAGQPGPIAGTPAPGEYVVQVIDPAGRVRGASPDAGTTPMLTAAELSQARLRPLTVTKTDENERERVLAAPLPKHPGWVAVAGVSLEALDRTLSDVSRELLIAGVVFVAAAGLGAYGLARAALSPVERLRREVAAALAPSATPPRGPGARAPGTRSPRWPQTMNELLGRGSCTAR